MAGDLLNDRMQNRILNRLWVRGEASRFVLCQEVGLSPSVMTKMTSDLIALGLIEEADAQRGPGRGRPSVPLRISPTAGYAIGAAPHYGAVDVTIVDFRGKPIAVVREPFDDSHPTVFARQVRRIALELVDRHNLLGRRLIGCGIGVPGPNAINDRAHWITVASLQQWRDTDLVAVMSDIFGMPVWVENDANTTALAEFYLSDLAQRCRSALVILFGHGIGAGVIEDGRLLKGQYGNVGEIGQLFPADKPRPSTADLMRTLRESGHVVSAVTDIPQLIDLNNPTVATWTKRAASQLAPVLSGALAWFDPGEIVLSGPLPQVIRHDLAQRLTKRRWEENLGRPAIRASSIGEQATVLGAALLPIIATAGISSASA
ncbi:ROK family protein [uncultured Sphingomonas sp.]|uniref:ROK family protein n=1 Tax=uncultured Sphingomonas sp. TaxID=158754 RepID=UPI0025DFE38F|nr:ROK family protein [uncultured Sphingomonas sp.]